MKGFVFFLSCFALVLAEDELSAFLSGSREFTGAIYNVSLSKVFDSMLTAAFSNFWLTTRKTSWSVHFLQKLSWL
jgi:hypothetical protein